jgi:inosose dehydratase
MAKRRRGPGGFRQVADEGERAYVGLETGVSRQLLGRAWRQCRGVTSVTQLSYRTFGDMDRACAEIAAAGYAGVELFDGNLLDVSAAEMRAMLAANGLQLVATYAGGNFIFDDILPEELARVTRAADRAAELGAPHLVVGGGAKRFDGTLSPGL